jgi:hypothetical protein
MGPDDTPETNDDDNGGPGLESCNSVQQQGPDNLPGSIPTPPTVVAPDDGNPGYKQGDVVGLRSRIEAVYEANRYSVQDMEIDGSELAPWRSAEELAALEAVAEAAKNYRTQNRLMHDRFIWETRPEGKTPYDCKPDCRACRYTAALARLEEVQR